MPKLYSRIDDHETVLELWGASTKHPDSVFYFSDFHLSEWFEPEEQTVPWLLECASKMNFPYHAFSLAQWACDRYKESRGWNDQFRPHLRPGDFKADFTRALQRANASQL